MAHGPQFRPMGLFNFQNQRQGRAWSKMIRPRLIVGQTPKMALLRPGPGQAGPGPGPNSSLLMGPKEFKGGPKVSKRGLKVFKGGLHGSKRGLKGFKGVQKGSKRV